MSDQIREGDQILQVETPLGRLLAVASSSDQTIVPGKDVRIMIRPESIDILPSTAIDAAPARLLRRQYLGQSTTCTCSVAGHEITISAPAAIGTEYDSLKIAAREPAIVLVGKPAAAPPTQSAG